MERKAAERSIGDNIHRFLESKKSLLVNFDVIF